MAADPPREVFLRALVPVLVAGAAGDEFPNAPTVEITEGVPLKALHPYLAIVEESESETVLGDHDGGEDDDFRFDVYGQAAPLPAAGLTARAASGRLLHYVKRALRLGSSEAGRLRHLPDVQCAWIRFGVEERGYSDAVGDFLLPCTARLNYPLAALHQP